MKTMKIEQPRPLAEIVAERLRNAIVDGELGLGESIAEEKLAESFGVSRTPVRDALALLQMQGLISAQPKRGSSVFRPTKDDVEHMCEFRIMTECSAFEIAIARAPQALATALADVVAQMTQARAANDTLVYGKLDTRFHETIIEHAGNPFLVDSYNLVSGKIAALRHHLTRPIAELRDISFEEHVQFVNFAQARDIDGFRQLMTLHINRTTATYVEAIETAEL